MAQSSAAQREPSMEEILASIRRIIEDTEPSVKPAPAAAPTMAAAANDMSPPEFLGRGMLDDGPDPLVLNEMLGAIAEQDSIEDAITAAVEQEVKWPADWAKLPEIDDEPALVARNEIETIMAATASVESRPSIVSEQTGRQVAASFGELSEAFAASRRRSLDEVAEEMLRPMLQDWLDNNLPVMVERLVREEIERVARGG